jgi:hypothetical protein
VMLGDANQLALMKSRVMANAMFSTMNECAWCMAEGMDEVVFALHYLLVQQYSVHMYRGVQLLGGRYMYV